MRVLIVEDEVRLAEALGQIMSEQKYAVDVVYTGTDGLDYALSGLYDVIVLDVMLPGRSGFDIVRELRAHKLSTPVLMLTAKVEDMDKITGLTLGADDYITKPFRPLELVARVKAQLRRYTKYNPAKAAEETDADVLRCRDLMLNLATHECRVGNRLVSLTPTEFSILRILLEQRGKVVSAEALFHAIWADEYYCKSSNTISVHVRHLREKLGDTAEHSKYIKTVWGVGYQIER